MKDIFSSVDMAMGAIDVHTNAYHSISQLSLLDKYQASVDINKAVIWIEQQLDSLPNVASNVELSEADGTVKWWDFSCPISWTPIYARFRIESAGDFLYEQDQSHKPYTIATNSKPLESSGRYPLRLPSTDSSSSLEQTPNGFLVIPQSIYWEHDWVTYCHEHALPGFITDAYSKEIDGQYYNGRIELPNENEIVAFSVTKDIIDDLLDAEVDEFTITYDVCIDQAEMMPVLECLIKGQSADEIWVTSHICHGRPGANDNCSGVAGSIEVIRILDQIVKENGIPDLSIRFLFGPEFTGSVSALYRHAKKHTMPKAVVNLDMIGENTRWTDAPFYLETEINPRSQFLSLISDFIVEQVFTESDIADKVNVTPFLGFSDHAVFMNWNHGQYYSPAIQLCHFPDKYNHTEGDTLDKVCFQKLATVVKAAASIVTFLSYEDYSSASIIGELKAKAKRNTEERRNVFESNISEENLIEVLQLEEFYYRNLLADLESFQSGRIGLVELLQPKLLLDSKIEDSGPLNLRYKISQFNPSDKKAYQKAFVQSKFTLALLHVMYILYPLSSSKKNLFIRVCHHFQREVCSETFDILWTAIENSNKTKQHSDQVLELFSGSVQGRIPVAYLKGTLNTLPETENSVKILKNTLNDIDRSERFRIEPFTVIGIREQ